MDLEFAVEIRNGRSRSGGIARNISVGGIFVATRRLHPVGDRVTLTFSLPEGDLLEAEAEIRWVRSEPGDRAARPRGMGLRFVDAPIAVRATIQELLRSK
jgi:uncharacterized protein (TIGR02266 family)